MRKHTKRCISKLALLTVVTSLFIYESADIFGVKIFDQERGKNQVQDEIKIENNIQAVKPLLNADENNGEVRCLVVVVQSVA